MATLTGKLADVTSKTPENISSITVKAPSARIGNGTDVIVSSPAEVTFDKTTGDITISGLTGGLSWLYIEGDGWSDSIPLAVAEGMITLVEAVANASGVPGLVDYINLINNAEDAIQDFINGLELDTYGGFQDASVNVDTLLAGGTGSDSRVYYRMASGGSTPDGGAGVLDVTNTGYQFTQVFYGTTNNSIWQRTISDRSHIEPGQWVFGDWKKLAVHDDVSVKADKSEADTFGGFQPASVDIDTLLAGGTNSNSRVYYNMASGGSTPDGGAGVLDVTNTAYQFTQVFYSTTNNAIYQRTISGRSHIVDGQWLFGEWEKLATHGDLEAKADKAEAVTYGGFQASSISMDTLLAGGTNSNSRVFYRINGGGDSPEGGAGVLVTTNAGYIFSQEFFSTATGAVYTRIITDRSHIVPDQWLFGEWQRQAVDDKSRMAAGEARRAAAVEAGLKRRGGVVGTGGKPAIALRFDHHLQQFGDKVLPHLKRLRLPWGQMINAGNIGSGNDTWTWAQLATECHDSGGEVWNHALTHGDVNNEFQADQAVTLGLSQLRENLPSLWIDSWAPPGQSNYMGFTNQSEPEKFYDTYPGRLVLAQHAFVRGSYPGPNHPLSGQNLIGQSHVTIDKQTSAWCQAAVRNARDRGSGLTMMLHSNYLDQSGYMTTNELVQVLEYIAARRDAGEIVVLSNAGILMADANTPVRQTNMLYNAEAGTNTGTWTQSVTSRVYPVHLGVPHEAEVWVKGSGQVTLKVEVASPTNPVTAQHQVTLGSSAQRLSVLVTPPNDATGTIVSLTGNVQHTGVNYRPI